MASLGDMNIHLTMDYTTYKTYWRLVDERIMTIDVALTDNPLIARDPHPAARYYVIGTDVFATKNDARRKLQERYNEQQKALLVKMEDLENKIYNEVD